MADSITWMLNADASHVRAEMNSAVRDVASGSGEMVNGFNRVDVAHGTLLKSGSRVSHQIANISREMLSGADATQVFASGLEGVGRSLKLSLGALAGLFVGGVIVSEIAKARSEMTKLHNDIARLGDRSDLNFEAFDKLSAKLTQIRAKMVELDQAYPKAGHYVTFRQIWNTLSHPIDSLTGGPEKDAATLRGSNRATMMAEVYRKARDNRISQASIDNPFAAERMKAFDEMMPQVRSAFMGKNMALVAEELRAYSITIKQINAKEQEHLKKLQDEKDNLRASQVASFKASLQLSLAEIASGGIHRKTGTFDSGRFYGGDVAQQALKEEQLAKKAMLGQNYAEAVKHMTVAEQLKSTIPALQDSDKMTWVKNAIDSSAKLDQLIKQCTFEGK